MRSLDRPRAARVAALLPIALVAIAASQAVAGAAAADGAPGAATRSAALPRVFFTPAERARITAARLAGRPMNVGAADGDASTRSPPSSQSSVAAPAAGAEAARGAGDVASTDPPLRAARIEGVTLGQGAAAAVWIGGQRVADGGRWGRWRVQVRRDGARLVGPDGAVRELRVGMELLP